MSFLKFLIESNDLHMWLDDIRDPRSPTIQQNYGAKGNEIWVTNVSEAKAILQSGRVVYMSLDHDLGEGQESGSDLAKWIEEESFFGRLKVPQWQVHSDNPEGKRHMIMALRSAEKIFGHGIEREK